MFFYFKGENTNAKQYGSLYVYVCMTMKMELFVLHRAILVFFMSIIKSHNVYGEKQVVFPLSIMSSKTKINSSISHFLVCSFEWKYKYILKVGEREKEK